LAALIALPAEAVAQAHATVRGQVLANGSDFPIAGVAISLGSQYSTRSDSTGRYGFAGIPAGVYTVALRRLGFVPLTSTITLTGGDSLVADFLMEPLPQTLPEIDVTTSLAARKLREFYNRQRFGIGSFMTEQQFVKAPGTRMSEKLRGLPGLQMIYPRGGFSSEVRVASSRGSQSIMLQRGPCISAIMIDGLLMQQPFYVNQMDPGEVAAIEWYAGPAQMPAEFNATRNSCGLLVIWTK
jgi:hypothetical protein